MNTNELINASRLIVKNNITSNIVAISLQWNEESKNVTIYYYTSQILSEDEEELCELSLTEIIAEFSDIQSINCEYIEITTQFDRKDILGHIIYCTTQRIISD